MSSPVHSNCRRKFRNHFVRKQPSKRILFLPKRKVHNTWPDELAATQYHQYLSSSVYSVFNVDAAAVKVQVLNGLGLTCVSFPIADTVTCYARIGFRFGAILTPAERIERCRLTV